VDCRSQLNSRSTDAALNRQVDFTVAGPRYIVRGIAINAEVARELIKFNRSALGNRLIFCVISHYAITVFTDIDTIASRSPCVILTTSLSNRVSGQKLIFLISFAPALLPIDSFKVI